MILSEPYNSWLVKNVGDNLATDMRFVVKVQATTDQGVVPVSIDCDITWFILLYSKDDIRIKLDMALELLKNAELLKQFQATLRIPNAKRMLAEFLLFNPFVLVGLRAYIDFTLLNVPIDFISHALFIKRTDLDNAQIDKERLQIVSAVLDTGFRLSGDIPAKSFGVAARKLLLMNVGDEKFTLVKRLLAAGFVLFSDVAETNNEIATILINSRSNKDCMDIITSNAARFQTLVFHIAGSNNGNLADYYYWVAENMSAVDFIRTTLNIDINK